MKVHSFFNSLVSLALLFSFVAVECSDNDANNNNTDSALTMEFNLKCVSKNEIVGRIFISETNDLLSKIGKLYTCGVDSGSSNSFKNCIVSLNLSDRYEEYFGEHSHSYFSNNLDFKNRVRYIAREVCDSLNKSFSQSKDNLNNDNSKDNQEYLVYSSKGKLILTSKNQKKQATQFEPIWALAAGSALILIALGVYFLIRKKQRTKSKVSKKTDVNRVPEATVVELNAPPAYENFTARTASIDSKGIDENINESDDESV